MKHLLLACLLTGSFSSTLAQTTKPAQYCLMEAEYKAKNRAGLTLITGADPAKTNQVEEVAQVAGMAYEADALNYLSTQGWEVISTTILTNSTSTVRGTRYYLRRKPTP